MFSLQNARLLVAATAIGAALLAPVPASAQVLLFFDDFLFDNAGQPGESLTTLNFAQFDVLDGTVSLVGGNTPGVDDPALGGRFVDLGGGTGNPGTFTTRNPLPLIAGQTYSVEFEYRSTLVGQASSGTATIDGNVFAFASDGGSGAFTPFTQTFTASTTGNAALAFQNPETDTDNNGIGIDSVRVFQVLPVTVPEPATGALLGLGAAGLGRLSLRRRAVGRN